MGGLPYREVSSLTTNHISLSPASFGSTEVTRKTDNMAIDTIVSAEVVASVQQKYSEERDKRIRSDGYAQYADVFTSEKFKRFQADLWVDANDSLIATLKDGDKCGVLVIGAGFGVLLFAIHLIKTGIDVNDICLVDSTSGFGGTHVRCRELYLHAAIRGNGVYANTQIRAGK